MVKKQPREKCLRCDKFYIGYPALSRRDNKTDICSDCGTEEAMVDFLLRKAQDTPFYRDYKFMVKLIRKKLK